MNFLKLTVVAFCSFLLTSPLAALTINSNNATYSRFSGGFPSAPIDNPSFFAADYDLSGIGWNNASAGQSFALISPQHAVFATHFLPGMGTTIKFLNDDSVLVSRTVASQTQIAGTDLSLLTFSSAFTEADKVKINPVLSMPTLGDYLGQTVWMYGQTAQMGSSNSVYTFQMISNISGPTLMSIYLRDYTTPGQAVGQVGDSGSPSFIPWDGVLSLIGTHSGIDVNVVISPGVTNDLTADAFIPAYISQLNAAMGSYRVSTIDVIPSGNYTTPGTGDLSNSAALYITNGATLLNNSGTTNGAGLYSDKNRKAVVTGAGSLWSNTGTLTVGVVNNSNSLQVLNNGVVYATNFIVGGTASSTGNTVRVNGGLLIITNAGGTSTYDLRRGIHQQFAGTTLTDNFYMTNSQATLVITGGAFTVKNSSAISNYSTLLLSGGVLSGGATSMSVQSNGVLIVNSTLTAAGGLQIAQGGLLEGHGSINGVVSGSGLVSPGNSPGILTVSQVDPSAGLDFAFEFTALGAPDFSSPAASTNDLMRITNMTAFTSSLNSGNSIDVYLNLASFSTGTYLGGFYLDSGLDIVSSISAATLKYWVYDAVGTNSFNGFTYNALNLPLYSISLSSSLLPADFGSGIINGSILGFNIQPVPEPKTTILFLVLISAVLSLSWLFKRPAKCE